MMRSMRARLKKGFTLAEVLIVVAILAALVGIATLLFRPQDIHRVEYNRTAESIAVAAQNRLTALRNAGQLDILQGIGAKEDKAEGTSTGTTTGSPDGGYRYLFSYTENADGTYSFNETMRYLVPFGSIDTDLDANYYAIGFQSESGMVGEVFYSVEPFKETTVAYLRSLSDLDESGKLTLDHSKERKSANIGYYVGEVDTQEVAPAQLPTPQLTISNYETLTLAIYLPKVRELEAYNKRLALRVSLADEEGKAYTSYGLSYDDTAIYRTYPYGGNTKTVNTTAELEMGQTYYLVLDTPDPNAPGPSSNNEVLNETTGLNLATDLANAPTAKFETWANRTLAYRGSVYSDTHKDCFRLGDNVRLTVTVYCLYGSGMAPTDDPIDPTYMSRSASVTTNGWFDSYDGSSTVTIACGRHLQNLANLTEISSTLASYLPQVTQKKVGEETVWEYSNYSRGNAYQYTNGAGNAINQKWDYRRNSEGHIVRDEITKAKQVKSIDFNSADWKKDGKPIPFTPINLPSGFTYYGNYQTIKHLWVDAPYYAGLFGYAYNERLYDILLVNPHVKSHMPAYVAEIYEMGVGALVGTSRDSQQIYNCQIYMEEEGGTVDKDGHISGGSYDSTNYRVEGNCYVGGLIGFCEDEDIRQNSASVFTGLQDGSSLYVGGLIGCATGDINIKRSYGAGDLSGQYVGGLLGVVMEDTNSAGDNYIIQSCYSAGHITLATKSAAGLIGRVWEQGGYYKSALGANGNYCAVIYGKKDGGSYNWTSTVQNYTVNKQGGFDSTGAGTTPTPIYGTFEGDGFEWLNASETGYLTGNVNGSHGMFLGADFDSDNENYFIPQVGITYADSPYFNDVKGTVNGLVAQLKTDNSSNSLETRKTNLTSTVESFRNKLRYAKLQQALEGMKREFENLIYELQCEEVGNSNIKDSRTKVEELYNGTFTAYYNDIMRELNSLANGTKTDTTALVGYLGSGKTLASGSFYNNVYKELKKCFPAYDKDQTQKCFYEFRVEDRIEYYLQTMQLPSADLKTELQKQKLLGIDSAIAAAEKINEMAKTGSGKWTADDKMGPYRDLIEKLSSNALTELKKLKALVEGEGITFDKSGNATTADFPTTTPAKLQPQIDRAFGYYYDLYRLFDADAGESVTMSKYTVALLVGVSDPDSIKQGSDYDDALKKYFGQYFSDEELAVKNPRWSQSSWAWKMTGGVKDINDDLGGLKENGKGMRTFRELMKVNDARYCILKAGLELNSGVEGILDRVEYLCTVHANYADFNNKEFDAEILSCIEGIDTMLGGEWEGHDSGHRIYSAYELRMIRSPHHAINSDFVYSYKNLDEYEKETWLTREGFVDQDNGIYNNVFPYNESEYTHYYPFLLIEGLEVEGGTMATATLFHYGDWLTNDLWAPDPASTLGGGVSHKYHAGNQMTDSLNSVKGLLQALGELSSSKSEYWGADDPMNTFKGIIDVYVNGKDGRDGALAYMEKLDVAIKNYEENKTDATEKALQEALFRAWRSYNELNWYLNNKYTTYAGGQPIGGITTQTVVEANGVFNIVDSGKMSDLITLIGQYSSIYNTVADEYGFPTMSADMATLWQLYIQLEEVEYIADTYWDDGEMAQYQAEAKSLTAEAKKKLEAFMKVADGSKDSGYVSALKEAWMAYWHVYEFFDGGPKDVDGPADICGAHYTKGRVGSGYQAMRRIRAFFGSDSNYVYKNALSAFSAGTDIVWPTIKQIELDEMSAQLTELKELSEAGSPFWNDADKMGPFKKDVDGLLGSAQTAIDNLKTAYADYLADPDNSAKKDAYAEALVTAWTAYDDLYRYFDDDSHVNTVGQRIINVEDALDTNGTIEGYVVVDDKSIGGMRSLRDKIFSVQRSALKNDFAKEDGVALPDEQLLNLQYIEKRLKEVKDLSDNFWTGADSPMAKIKENDKDPATNRAKVDVLLESAIDAMSTLESKYESYLKDPSTISDYKAALNTAWDRLMDLYEYFDQKAVKELNDYIADGVKANEGSYSNMRSIRAIFQNGYEKLATLAKAVDLTLTRE